MQLDYFLQRSRRRTISLQVDSKRKLIVKAPLGMSSLAIQEFIEEKKNWVLKQFERIDRQVQSAQEMGFLSEKDIEETKKLAKKLIPQRVAHYAAISGITYNKIFIRLQQSRWGSCSARGNLNFNCLLALMPLEILDSVVVHELCHRRHMDHSKAFYQEVISIFPDYMRCEKWLKNNGGTYFARISSESSGE